MNKILFLFISLLPFVANARDAEINGIYYNIDGNSGTASVVMPPSDAKYSGDVVIPESIFSNGIEYVVTSIDHDAFFFCSDLLSVTIGDNVKEIGAMAFSQCNKLSDVIFGKRVEKIGDSAFSGCTSLQTISLPSGIEIIGESAFFGCTKLSSVLLPSSLTQINSMAFSCCVALENVNIPFDITEISDYAFYGCSSLKSAVFPEGLKIIGNGSFYGCKSLETLNLPSGILSIGEEAFALCETLTELIIPNGFTTIEKMAFYGGFGLKKIMLPSTITSIGEMAFYSMGIIYGGDVYCYATDVPSIGNWGFYVDITSHMGILHVPAASIEKYRTAPQWKLFAKIVPITDDEQYPSSIEPAKMDNRVKSSKIFGIDGQRLINPKKGINIINGRKVLY